MRVLISVRAIWLKQNSARLNMRLIHLYRSRLEHDQAEISTQTGRFAVRYRCGTLIFRPMLLWVQVNVVYVQFRNVETAQELAPILRSAWSEPSLTAEEILTMPETELREHFSESFERVQSFLSKLERLRQRAEIKRKQALAKLERDKERQEREYAKFYHNPISPSLDNRLNWVMDAVELQQVKASATKKRAELFNQAREIVNTLLIKQRAERGAFLKLARQRREQRRIERVKAPSVA
jgi:hypothetical protein